VIPIAGSPSALAFGAGGLWVSDEFGERVLRIDPSTRRESAALDVGNRPKGLAVVPAAGVWVAVRASGTGHRGGRPSSWATNSTRSIRRSPTARTPSLSSGSHTTD
jgi:hypothetical protein